MPESSWSLKTIRLTFVLGQGTFGTEGNAKVIEGLPVDVSVEKTGMPGMNQAEITVSGLSLADMEQLTRFAFRPLWTLRNSVTVEAGEKGGALSTVFSGGITAASADFNRQPDVPFRIRAHTGAFGALVPASPVSVQGYVPVDKLMRGFAKELGLSYTNEGVASSVKNAVFNGSPLEKARSLARQAGINLIVDDKELVILPKEKTRKGGAAGVPLLTAETGLIGYPVLTDMGISFKCLYDPRLRFGGGVRVKTTVPRASGEWRIVKLSHRLSAYHAGGGAWFSEANCVFPSMYLGA